VEVATVSHAARAHPKRPAPGAAEDGFLVTDVGWNKNGVAQQFPITVQERSLRRAVWPRWGSAGGGPRRELAHPHRSAVSLVGDGGFSANPSVVATAMEADLPVVWVVMDNESFGTIAGLENMHYGWSFGCLFERHGKPYHVDYAAMARSFGARGVSPSRQRTNSIQRWSRRSNRTCLP
jgi:acetolactate synthase-1/2/3 large subunit